MSEESGNRTVLPEWQRETLETAPLCGQCRCNLYQDDVIDWHMPDRAEGPERLCMTCALIDMLSLQADYWGEDEPDVAAIFLKALEHLRKEKEEAIDSGMDRRRRCQECGRWIQGATLAIRQDEGFMKVMCEPCGSNPAQLPSRKPKLTIG